MKTVPYHIVSYECFWIRTTDDYIYLNFYYKNKDSSKVDPAYDLYTAKIITFFHATL